MGVNNKSQKGGYWLYSGKSQEVAPEVAQQLRVARQEEKKARANYRREHNIPWYRSIGNPANRLTGGKSRKGKRRGGKGGGVGSSKRRKEYNDRAIIRATSQMKGRQTRKISPMMRRVVVPEEVKPRPKKSTKSARFLMNRK